MHLLYKADQSIDAHLLKGLLLQQGIIAQVQGDLLAGATGELPAYGLVHLWVPDDCIEMSQKILQQWLNGEFALPDDTNE